MTYTRNSPWLGWKSSCGRGGGRGRGVEPRLVGRTAPRPGRAGGRAAVDEGGGEGAQGQACFDQLMNTVQGEPFRANLHQPSPSRHGPSPASRLPQSPGPASCSPRPPLPCLRLGGDGLAHIPRAPRLARPELEHLRFGTGGAMSRMRGAMRGAQRGNAGCSTSPGQGNAPNRATKSKRLSVQVHVRRAAARGSRRAA